MTVNDSKFYLSYLNKLVDQYNDIYHHSIHKKPANADNSFLTEKIEKNPKALTLKVSDRVRITKYEKKYLLSIPFWKLFLGLIKLNI